MKTFSVNQSTKDQIQQHLIRVSKDYIPPLTDEFEYEKFADKLASKSTRIEYFDNGNLVAVIAVYVNKEENFAYGTNFSIEKSYRGMGLSIKLHDQLLAHISELNKSGYGISSLRAEVRSEQILAFYTKIGYNEIQRRENSSIIELKL